MVYPAAPLTLFHVSLTELYVISVMLIFPGVLTAELLPAAADCSVELPAAAPADVCVSAASAGTLSMLNVIIAANTIIADFFFIFFSPETVSTYIAPVFYIVFMVLFSLALVNKSEKSSQNVHKNGVL